MTTSTPHGQPEPAPPAVNPFTFPAHRGGGLFLGLGATQVVILSIGFLVAFVSFQTGTPLLALVSLGLAAMVALGQIHGLYVWELARAQLVGATALLTRRHWRTTSTIPVSSLPPPPAPDRLPPCLRGVQLHPGRAELNGSGLIFDTADRSLIAVLRVPGVAFTLLSSHDQMGLLAGWGEVLRGFATEAGPVTRLTWSDWSVPASLTDHTDWVDDQTGGPDDARASYADLLSTVSGHAVSHDLTIAIAVSAERTGGRSRRRRLLDRLEAVLAQAVTELTSALRSAGLDPAPALSPEEVAALVRDRTDPFGWRPGPEAGPLVQRLGLPATTAARTELAMRSYTTDGAIHRTFQIIELPQTPLPANWFRPVLQANGAHRAITVVLEPVAPSTSRRRIGRELIRLETDADTRAERGFRISAAHRRNLADAEAREHELISGFPEYHAALLLTVTAPDRDALTEDCATVEAVARQHGLLLRPRDGEHDIAWATALPIGLGLAPESLL